jgi:hypothetical protein
MDIASLLSDQAQKFIKDHINDDPAELMLRGHSLPGVYMQDLVKQIKAHHIVRNKIPHWFQTTGLVYGESRSLEQSSSEITAKYKSRLVEGSHLIDLTGGLGVDSYFLSTRFKQLSYVESDPVLCAMAENNFRALGANHIRVFEKQAEEYISDITSVVDWVYIDPDRRAGNQRKFLLNDCQPNVTSIIPHLLSKTKRVMLKLSPLLDIQLVVNTLDHVKEVHVVSVRNDCKELIVIIENGYSGIIKLTGVNFLANDALQSFSFRQDQETTNEVEYSNPLSYLYQPNSSVMKLGAYNLLCQRFDLAKLHVNSHLFTSQNLIRGFPGRYFKIRWSSGYKPKQIRKMIPAGKANVTTRNFVKDVKSIRKECRLSDGGEDYLFFTRGPAGKLMVINGHKI